MAKTLFMRQGELAKQISGDTYICHIDKNGILNIKIHENPSCTLEQVQEVMATIEAFGKEKMPFIFADIRKAKSIPVGTLKTVNHHKQILEAIPGASIVVESPISRIVGSFFIGIQKPPFPIQMFNKPDHAYLWLQKLQSGYK